MAVHIFTVSEENYNVCVEKGLVAIPEAKEGAKHDNVVDGLLSRLAGIKENDYVLMYVIKSKSLRGVWQVKGLPFYEETQVWQDRIYPFRCKIKWSEYSFQNALMLDDINDLRNVGKIWTWALERSTGSNSMFSISNGEFLTLLTEFMKINPFTIKKGIILQPYPHHVCNIIHNLHFKSNGYPKYEYTIMALLNAEFAKGSYTDIFGNYSDYLCYVPTNLGKEMDFLLMYDNPLLAGQVVSYDIIEVKRDEFNEDALSQLIGYESWLLQKKFSVIPIWSEQPQLQNLIPMMLSSMFHKESALKINLSSCSNIPVIIGLLILLIFQNPNDCIIIWIVFNKFMQIV